MRPAPLHDLALMLAATGALADTKGLGPVELAARHAAGTRSFGALERDLCIACGGLYRHPGGDLEAWFACRPEAARSIVALVKAMRLTLALIGETERVEIRARVAKGWESGRRLARLVGFRLEQVEGGREIWSRGL